jgi:16S rRNA A1518/A1519 N6-dimethyltransferase RsmA/KsgA/DIM1 with predicted DNA glycosylase/AP lyase activity
VDAAVLEIARRDQPLVPREDFERYATFVRQAFASRSDAPEGKVGEWVSRFRG